MPYRSIYSVCTAILTSICAVRAACAQALYVAPKPAAQAAAVAPAAKPADEKIKVEVVAGDDDAKLDPAEQQMRDRLQPVLKREVAFAARVCKLDKTQRKTLADAGQEALKKAAYQSMHAPAQGQQPAFLPPRVVIFNGGRNVVQAQSNPIKLLQDALVDAAKEKLPPKIAKQFAGELAKRAEYRKHAVIDNLVVMLDKKLSLTQEQRSEIAKSLADGWDDSWAPQLQVFMYDQDMFPAIPDNCILPHLQPAQKTLWESLPNRNVQFAFDAFEVDPFTGGIANDSDSDDDP
jgi:hypothetical protein